jgi:CopG family transcriptional regulator/antitoxin EndoAI
MDMSSMENKKRIVISLPDYLLDEVDVVVEEERLNRSEWIRQAMSQFLSEKKKQSIRERMQRGYAEMANINLRIASESFLVEGEADRTMERLVSGV